MCGICGIYVKERVDEEVVIRMNNNLIHRGPDGEGYYYSNNVGFGHRRLRIIDLDTGDQPIHNEDQSISIVFNGEIYNYKELRDKLIALGHKLTTKSDTETIVHLYEEYGLECVRQLNGMFAFAIWDKKKQRLLLARDRLGVKPLVYCKTHKEFLFASELRSLLASKKIETVVDDEAIAEYLTLGYIAAPKTIYKNVMKLEPGHLLLVENGGQKLTLRRYWNVLENTIALSQKELPQKLRSMTFEAVKRRMVSDVPLGALLSGGLDSTLVTGIMSKLSNEKVKTFSIGFPDQPVLDESTWAQKAAAYYDTDHRQVAVSASDIRTCIPEILDNLGEPFSGGGSILPTYLVSKIAKENVTVVLSGDGADELFAGYDKYLGTHYLRYYAALPNALRNKLIEPLINFLPSSREKSYLDLARIIKRFISGTADGPSLRHFLLMRVCSHQSMTRLIPSTESVLQSSVQRIEQLFSEYDQAIPEDSINQMLYSDFSFSLPNDMLTKVDLASMYNSLEVRSPFLDYELAELAFSIPGRCKMRGGSRKIVLRKAFDDILPAFVLRRPKKGFDLPIGSWLKNDLRDIFWDVVTTRRGPVDLSAKELELLFTKHDNNEEDFGKQLWAIFVLKYWSINIHANG